MRTRLLPPAALGGALAACVSTTDPPASTADTIDASAYFPVTLGRYWVLFDPEGRFLTLEFTRRTTVVGVDVDVLTYTFDADTTDGETVDPAYEQYFVNDPEQGVLLYGYRDLEAGLTETYLPGVVFAGSAMELEVPVTTETAASGTLTRFTTTLVAQGIVQTYYGDFPDAIDITMGPEGGEQPKHFLALDKGMVKFEWQGVRYQLYDYGIREE